MWGFGFFNVFCLVDFGFCCCCCLGGGGCLVCFVVGFYFRSCFGEFCLVGYFLNGISRIGANASVSAPCCWY